MRKFLIVMAALSLIACGDDIDEALEECVDGVECAPEDKTPEPVEECVDEECPPEDETPGPNDDCVDDECAPEDETPEPVKCGALESPANGSVEQPEEAIPGALATYHCEPERELVGEAERVCNEEGEWEGDAPICVIPRCLASKSVSLEAHHGLDLDGQITEEAVTPPAPETGCGFADAEGGVDNGLTRIQEIFWPLGINLIGAISESLNASQAFEFTLSESDDEAYLDMSFNGQPLAQNRRLEKTSSGLFAGALGMVSFDFKDLDLDNDFAPGFKADLKLTLHDARVEVDPSSGDVSFGGTLVYGDADSGDEAFRPGLRQLLVEMTAEYGDPDGVMVILDYGFRDINDISLGGETCDGISFGAKIEHDFESCE